MAHAIVIGIIGAAGLLTLRCLYVAANALAGIAKSHAILATLYIAWAASAEQRELQDAAAGIIVNLMDVDEP